MDREKLLQYIDKYIYQDSTLPVNDIDEIIRRIERVFKNKSFLNEAGRSKKNWMNLSTGEVLKKYIEFVKTLK